MHCSGRAVSIRARAAVRAQQSVRHEPGWMLVLLATSDTAAVCKCAQIFVQLGCPRNDPQTGAYVAVSFAIRILAPAHSHIPRLALAIPSFTVLWQAHAPEH